MGTNGNVNFRLYSFYLEQLLHLQLHTRQYAVNIKKSQGYYNTEVHKFAFSYFPFHWTKVCLFVSDKEVQNTNVFYYKQTKKKAKALTNFKPNLTHCCFCLFLQTKRDPITRMSCHIFESTNSQYCASISKSTAMTINFLNLNQFLLDFCRVKFKRASNFSF